MSELSNQEKLSRRAFIRNIGAGAVAATVAPSLLQHTTAYADDATPQKPNITGAGRHTYEVVPNWGKLPEGVKYGYTHGVVEDSQGRIFIHNQSDDAVIIFDPDGKFIKSWGKDFKDGAHGMQLRKEGNTEYLYLADYWRHIVVKTTLDGEEVWTLHYPKEAGVYEKEDQYKPTNVAFGPNGDFYVADGYGQSYIHQYNQKAEYIRTWGGKGDAPGKMNCPHGIWLDARGQAPILVVADRENHRLQNFTLDGQHINFVNDELRRPCHFSQRNGDLLIPDLHGRVTIFDKENKLVTHLGDSPDIWKTPGWPNLAPEKLTPGKFSSPHAAIWDHNGNIYVVEWINYGRVTKLRHIA